MAETSSFHCMVIAAAKGADVVKCVLGPSEMAPRDIKLLRKQRKSTLHHGQVDAGRGFSGRRSLRFSELPGEKKAVLHEREAIQKPLLNGNEPEVGGAWSERRGHDNKSEGTISVIRRVSNCIHRGAGLGSLYLQLSPSKHLPASREGIDSPPGWRQVSGQVAVHGVGVAVAVVVHGMPGHDAGRPVVIRTPPTSRALLAAAVRLSFFALAAFAVFVVALVVVMVVVGVVPEPSRECDFVKSFCTEWTKWRIRPGLSLRCSVVVVVVEVRWYCSVWKPSRCRGICFSNWSRRFAGIRFILPLPPCEEEPPSSRESLPPEVLPPLSREALP
ncbi:hypothetical protein EYF80_006613 [Liparis tanakae]|uniref:Uncharacterized protein n=1 Tax=Liparis tanakae TaxID=230148 RepID=A0A4Z2IYP2_9TELE|nr:hypothetical protein EYF80_006613 [Liparis tanakae]